METFGRYTIIERIAHGGMAEVLLARSDELEGVSRLCAVKRISRQYSGDAQFVSMFIDEARITIGLDHENIVKLFDFGQVDDVYYMAMEYVDGSDLSCLLKSVRERGVPLPPNAVAFIASEVLHALEHAHGACDFEQRKIHLVHRDVSPQNILLGADGAIKLTDFGIAAARNKLTLTMPGTVLGKSAYMSPEQAIGEGVDQRSDLWAVGVIIYEAVTGRRQFAADNDMSTLKRVLEGPILAPSSARPGIPFKIDKVVLKALQRDKTRRYQTAKDMRDDLLEVLADDPFGIDDMARLVEATAWTDTTFSMRPHSNEVMPGFTDPERRAGNTALDGIAATDDVEARTLQQQLIKEPSPWTLVALGERYREMGANDEARRAFCAASLFFAHKGQLVQSVCAIHGARTISDPRAHERDLLVIGDVAPDRLDELADAEKRLDCRSMFDFLRAGLAAPGESAALRRPTPLLGYLAPREFARLAAGVRVSVVAQGTTIVEEDDAGDSLFAIARGRAVVACRRHGHTTDTISPEDGLDRDPTKLSSSKSPILSDRVYLSALADGDFFGEFSFLTGRPRSANVEAITDMRLLEIDQALADELFAADPAFTEPLLRFYKERVIELMMAKSPVFSLLRPGDRKSLLEQAELIHFVDEDLIVKEGQIPGSLYFMKSGEVEIFRSDERGGAPIFINKLSQGDYFGEIGAVTGERRTVSVRAMGDVSAFRIPREPFNEIIAREPTLKALFDDTIAARTLETKARIDEHRQVFYGT